MRTRVFVWIAVVFLATMRVASGCGPGRGAGRRRGPRKLTPLVFKQHVPNVSENTLPASGLTEGRITREDPRFRDLVPNYNTDIVFRDEEGTGADRLMTQRCKEKLNTLAISVMNQWPGVKLRVTEGWDEEDTHSSDSLHYEGRAVDVTTSDRDRSKYGMLARLAVEAGFDWVYYESRAHIHCSVKSESSQAAKTGGCFTAETTVQTSRGTLLRLEELRVGERILALDTTTGSFKYSEVILFLDRDPEQRREFLRLRTASGRTLTVTPSHLLMVASNTSDTYRVQAVFADRVKVGDRVLIHNRLQPEIDTVISTEAILKRGVYAPLTREGTVVVDGIVASCYAVVDSQSIAHWSYAPFRLYKSFLSLISKNVSSARSVSQAPIGVHWYANILYTVAQYILPNRMLHSFIV
ncbi:sonic hedgehog protein isoform X1 [Zootermopsis nevadensis]|nr:sonic hedgehog protein isoform X1 [Zootermopsis nevadensis]